MLTIVDIRKTDQGTVIDIRNGGILPYSIPFSEFKVMPGSLHALVDYALIDPEHDAFAEPPTPLAEQMAAELAREAETFPVDRNISEHSPTKDDQIADYITSLTPDEREHAANIIDGVSSREWWDGIEPIEY